MSRLHGLAISLMLAVATGTGAYAMMVTANLGKATSKPEVASNRAIAKQKAQLNRWSASLTKSLKARPPALPALPQYRPVTLVTAPASPAMPVVATPASQTATAQAVAATPTRVSKPAPHTTGLHTDLSASVVALNSAKTAREAEPPARTAASDRETEDETTGPVQTATFAAPAAPVAPAAPAAPAVPAVPADPPAPTTTTAAAAPVTTTVAATPTTTTSGASAWQAVQQQCQALKQAAENGTEAAKQAAERQCEALKNALEKHD